MKDFDYIIIGGGCAGLSLAYELEIDEKLKECILFSDLMYPTDSLFSKSINNFVDW